MVLISAKRRRSGISKPSFLSDVLDKGSFQKSDPGKSLAVILFLHASVLLRLKLALLIPLANSVKRVLQASVLGTPVQWNSMVHCFPVDSCCFCHAAAPSKTQRHCSVDDGIRLKSSMPHLPKQLDCALRPRRQSRGQGSCCIRLSVGSDTPAVSIEQQREHACPLQSQVTRPHAAIEGDSRRLQPTSLQVLNKVQCILPLRARTTCTDCSIAGDDTQFDAASRHI
mmetsp:Transcript_118909/g.205569  ORF Transcript_118909/g.205569 Transcript_118909/m.205569 type:complete len:226 (-) Transcript_118909:703-1380(-)